jgi:hypothetical protein
MRFGSFAIVAGALLCTGLVATDALAQRRDRDNDRRDGRWVQLGCQQVSFIGKDRDAIRVGRREGRFKAIKLAARGNDVEMLDLKVIYANGQPDDIRVRSVIRAGRETGPLDLRGGDRAIERIEMVYRSRPNFRGSATVCAEGRD